jgi:hypothetical protein
MTSTTHTPPAAIDIRRLARLTGAEAAPGTILRGLDDAEASIVTRAIAADLVAHPWPVDGAGRLQDSSEAMWGRIRGTVLNARGERFEQATRRPHYSTHRHLLDVVLCLRHAAAARAELEAALADLDDLLAVTS